MSNSNEGPDRIDYQETPDITEVHAAVQREKPEPSAEVTPMPLWLTGVCAFATVWAGIYFGIFNGGLSGNVFNEYESSPAVLFPLPEKPGGKGAGAEVQTLTLAQQGKSVFGQVCASCHQPTGLGLPGQYPPLAGSDIVQGSEKRVVAIVLKGLGGPITVFGQAVLQCQCDAALGSAIVAEEDRRGPQLRSSGMGQQGRGNLRGQGGCGEEGIRGPDRLVDRSDPLANPGRCDLAGMKPVPPRRTPPSPALLLRPPPRAPHLRARLHPLHPQPALLPPPEPHRLLPPRKCSPWERAVT
ncbi:MAG: c-type cytochrome [Chthoniobacter sp.]